MDSAQWRTRIFNIARDLANEPKSFTVAQAVARHSKLMAELKEAFKQLKEADRRPDDDEEGFIGNG